MMSPRLNWRLLLGEFVVIVFGVLIALWVDELREASDNAALEIEYLESFVTDLEADLAQFDETEAWMRRSEAAELPSIEELMAALKAYPELERTAGEVLYQTINMRAGLGSMRIAALELKAELEQWLASST